MHTLKIAVPLLLLSSMASAGPTLACHEWVSTAGSTFEILEPLRDAAMYTANHRTEADAARAKIASLRSSVRNDDPVSLLKAGYWITILNSMRITPDTDGPELMRRAAELRAGDPEYQFFAALAYFDTDEARYREYWKRAQSLAKPGTAVSRNLANFEPVLLSRKRSQ